MKTVVIVQARMGSSRLPGKVMRDIDGKPMIYYTLTRLKNSKYIDQIVLATSDKEIDTPLAVYVESLGIEVFRGDEDNVLERYKLASSKYNADIIIRVTGDCPLIDPIILDHMVTKYMIYDYDYIKMDIPNTFIRGFDVEVFSREVLERVYDIVCIQNDIKRQDFQVFREHVTYYIYNHLNEFKVGIIEGESHINTEINLSVDTIQDFERVKKFVNVGSYKEIKNSYKKIDS